jgi:hypothetical protein
LGAAAAAGGETDTITDVHIIFHGRKKNEMTKKNKQQQRKRAHFDLYTKRTR